MLLGSSKVLLQCCRRSLATVTSHEPVSGGPTLALPLAFLSPRWTSQPVENWAHWISSGASQGYSALEIKLEGDESTSLPELTADLRHALRQSVSPFPPLLFARAGGALVAQDYVSSNPLSGLVLVDPPLTIEDHAVQKALTGLRDADEFNFEPFFPIALVASSEESAETLQNHRLLRDFPEDVELITTLESREPLGKEAFELVLRWMDARRL